MHIRPALKASLLGVAITFLAVSPAKADELYGKIRGVATDPAGAVIVGAEVTATNVQTGLTKRTTSNANGSYEFLQLPAPADYDISARQSGFKAFEAKGIHLDINQIYQQPVRFELGAVTQSVVVEANAAQIESTSMQLGSTVTTSTIQDMPLNGRNWLQLQQLQPGVMAA